MRRTRLLPSGSAMLAGVLLALATSTTFGEPPRTTLSDRGAHYTSSGKHYAVLRSGEIEAVVVDNSAVDDRVLPGHGEGYSGIASLKHIPRGENVFVPAYSGLNYEHIHDGTTQPRDVIFEPRKVAMQLRIIDDHTAELYQAPTPHWKLESCTRYALLADGTFEVTFQCIPRAPTFANGYLGVFFASYIHQPESKAIHFWGHDRTNPSPRLIEATSPSHGVQATHRGTADQRDFKHAVDFSASLVFNFSDYRFEEPWYYGVSHRMALAFVFRDGDGVRFSQSPTGGGKDNPAWDFQWFIEHAEVGHTYTFVTRVLYVPFESPEQVMRKIRSK